MISVPEELHDSSNLWSVVEGFYFLCWYCNEGKNWNYKMKPLQQLSSKTITTVT